MTNLAFNVRPFAEHVPDSGPDSEHKNPATVEAGAGMLELGFYVGDNRIVLSSLKAGAYTDLFENGDPTTGRPAQGQSESSSGDQSAPAENEQTPPAQ